MQNLGNADNSPNKCNSPFFLEILSFHAETPTKKDVFS